jgi:hypothetical protein
VGTSLPITQSSYAPTRILFRNGELNLLLPGSGCPLQTGTGHGRSGRTPGRCGCAVTSLLQRDCGRAVCGRQDIYLPAILLSWVRGTWRGGRGGRAGGSVGVLRARRCHLRAGFQQCKSFVEMCTVRCCPLWHPAHCPMGTVPLVLVRRTASPAHADFGGLSSGAAPVVVRLDVVSFPPRSSAPTVAGCRVGGYPVGRDQ